MPGPPFKDKKKLIKNKLTRNMYATVPIHPFSTVHRHSAELETDGGFFDPKEPILIPTTLALSK